MAVAGTHLLLLVMPITAATQMNTHMKREQIHPIRDRRDTRRCVCVCVVFCV